MIHSTVPGELLFHFEVRARRGSLGKKLLTQHRLPALEKLARNEAFRLYMGWEPTALYFRLEVMAETISVSYPSIEEGDSIELFIDTRNIKTARSTHRFYHHFFFLPERIEGVQCGEITRFRTEDRHPLADPKELVLKIEKIDDGYAANIEIPASCLHGYHGEAGERLGLFVRVNRSGNESVEWAIPTGELSLFKEPYMYPTVVLVEDQKE